MTKKTEQTEELKLVWGADAIAKVIGRSTRATFHMLNSGELPAKRVCGRWVADRGELVRFFSGAAA